MLSPPLNPWLVIVLTERIPVPGVYVVPVVAVKGAEDLG